MIKFFKTKKNFKKKVFNPNFYWVLLIYGTLFLSLLFLFFGYYLFRQISKEPVLGTTTLDYQQIKTVKKERIDAVLKYFSEREKKSNQILNSPSPLVDPSL